MVLGIHVQHVLQALVHHAADVFDQAYAAEPARMQQRQRAGNARVQAVWIRPAQALAHLVELAGHHLRGKLVAACGRDQGRLRVDADEQAVPSDDLLEERVVGGNGRLPQQAVGSRVTPVGGGRIGRTGHAVAGGARFRTGAVFCPRPLAHVQHRGADALGQLLRCLAREGQSHDGAGVHGFLGVMPGRDELDDALGHREGLARPRARDDEHVRVERFALDDLPLLRGQLRGQHGFLLTHGFRPSPRSRRPPRHQRRLRRRPSFPSPPPDRRHPRTVPSPGHRPCAILPARPGTPA